MDTKICCSCKTSKLINEFWKMKSRKDGLDPRCAKCASKQKAQSTQRTKIKDPKAFNERRKRYRRTYCLNHPDRIDAYNHKRNLRRKFNMTVDEYNSLLNKQNGVCAICFELPVTKRLAVDHDAETSVIRGLLCANCNTAIGLLKHNLQRLDSAKNYLQNG
jgi:Recombination endonuclease VII.